MDSNSAKQLLREMDAFAQVRGMDWQGEDARGGMKYTIQDESRADDVHMKGVARSESLWHAIEAAAGGGAQGKEISRLMQKQLLQRVEGMALDEIEMLAGGKPCVDGIKLNTAGA